MRHQRALSLSLNSFTVKDGKGEDFPMSQFRRVPVVLIVNVASHCEYTDRHYRELQALRADYAEEKLAVIAFPSNQFGGCEPGTWQEIVSSARRHYGVTFPIMAKVNINGHQSDPLFAWLKAASGNAAHVPWNFTKFLVMGGDMVKRYSHDVSVKEIERDITGALDACPDFGCEP